MSTMCVARPTYLFEPAQGITLRIEEVTSDDMAPASCADRVFADMCLHFPDAYVNDESGYTRRVIADHLSGLEQEYPATFRRNLDTGDKYFMGLADVVGDSIFQQKFQRGFTKVGLTTAPYNQAQGMEIKEVVAPELPEAHMGSALVYLAVRDLDEREPVHGRILGYNARAIELATSGLGMRLLRRDSGVPFGNPGRFKMLAEGRKKVDWSWYGALAGDMKDRLTQVYPWLESVRQDG